MVMIADDGQQTKELKWTKALWIAAAPLRKGDRFKTNYGHENRIRTAAY